MKMSFKKHSPEERHSRDYKYFDWTKFKHNLNEKLSEGISSIRVQVRRFLSCQIAVTKPKIRPTSKQT